MEKEIIKKESMPLNFKNDLSLEKEMMKSTSIMKTKERSMTSNQTQRKKVPRFVIIESGEKQKKQEGNLSSIKQALKTTDITDETEPDQQELLDV